ncbi:hypothetical protein [Chryseobacterium sp. KCF3-3]|uniref:hypothetical protein n=1 Tax=Chryseobacterium sp. KCF3-3 TaxID=3231511 RepID=UPI0038B25894
MKNVILFLVLILFNSCIAQQTIKSISDDKLVENIVSQFGEKAKIKVDSSVFVLYFQEKQEITEVQSGISHKHSYNGFTIIIYRFKSIYQISEFIKDYNVYKKSENTFCIFDKSSSSEFVKRLKTNKLSYIKPNNDSGYDPKSWVLNFDAKGNLEKCYPYNCN